LLRAARTALQAVENTIELHTFGNHARRYETRNQQQSPHRLSAHFKFSNALCFNFLSSGVSITPPSLNLFRSFVV
jgi:hypothetical protein